MQTSAELRGLHRLEPQPPDGQRTAVTIAPSLGFPCESATPTLAVKNLSQSVHQGPRDQARRSHRLITEDSALRRQAPESTRSLAEALAP